jgi:hypothetical protein
MQPQSSRQRFGNDRFEVILYLLHFCAYAHL